MSRLQSDGEGGKVKGDWCGRRSGPILIAILSAEGGVEVKRVRWPPDVCGGPVERASLARPW
jgi:hypothetical protein